MLYCSYLIVILSLVKISAGECSKNKEKPAHLRIREDIFCDYDKTVRPVTNINATTLDIKLFVHNIHYAAHSSTLDVSAWLGLRWKDQHIYWDPEKYDGIETILVNAKDIWTPDLSIWNRGIYGSTKLFDETSDACVLFYHKQIICISELSVYAMCEPDLRHYPFDIQNCTLVIGSWFHSGEEIDLADTEIISDIGYVKQESTNSEWNLISSDYWRNPGIYKHSPNDTYPSLEFIFVVKRNAAAKFAIQIVPILISIGMTILTLWLDPTTSDRTFIVIVNISIHIMFILNCQWELPETGPSVPYLIQLLRNSVIIILLSLIETVIVRHLLNKANESPRILVNFFTVIATNKFGQMLLFLEFNPEGASENLTADDSSNLVDMKQRPKEWYLLGKIVDRLAFVGAIFGYFIMFVYYVSH